MYNPKRSNILAPFLGLGGSQYRRRWLRASGILIYRNRHQPQPNWDEVDKRLREDGLYEVAHNLYDLSEYLFGDGEETPLMVEMADYVLKGGLYGDARRGAAIEIAKASGKRKAVLRQVFRNRKEFENRYPWLKKWPILLPVAWGMRLAHSLKVHRGVIWGWKKSMDTVSEKEVEVQKEKLKRFGL